MYEIRQDRRYEDLPVRVCGQPGRAQSANTTVFVQGQKVVFITGSVPASTMRDECFNEHLFASLKDARRIIEAWKIDYNTQRPHTSLDGLTPIEFAARPEQGHNRNRLYSPVRE